MSNMSYCRFENTYRDLKDCQEALQDEGGVEGIEEEASQNEKPYIKDLIELCREIVDEFECEIYKPIG